MNVDSAIIIPVHNRRATTLACLARLTEQGVLTWARVLVVDDGSTDGTRSAIEAEFPGIEVIDGTGSLYWTGATALGMQHALRGDAAFLFWLNDDCAPAPGALEALREAAQRTGGVAGGIAKIPGSDVVVYGGFEKCGADLRFVDCQPGDERACDALNGNLVCLPRAVVEAVGLPEAAGLPHAFGDTDYTLRVRAAGFPITLVGNAPAEATPNHLANHASWLVGDITVRQLWGALGDVRSYAYLPAHWRFLTRHWGVRGALRCLWLLAKRVPFTVLMLVLPRSVRRRWWGHRSATWQHEERMRKAIQR